MQANSVMLKSDLMESVNALPHILTVAEVSEFMRLSGRTIRRMIASGRLQATKADPSAHGKVLITRASVLRALSRET